MIMRYFTCGQLHMCSAHCAHRHKSCCKSLPHDQHINNGPSQLFHISERTHVPGYCTIAIVLFSPAWLGDSQNREGTENCPILNAWNSCTSTSPQLYFFWLRFFMYICAGWNIDDAPTQLFSQDAPKQDMHISACHPVLNWPSLLGCKIHFFWGTNIHPKSESPWSPDSADNL